MSNTETYPPISDYGLISDMHSCALVSKTGSIDWCCFPRFDSAAVFSRILDWGKGGYFKVAPGGVRSVSRRYLQGTNILETTFETDTGVARLTDFMPTHPHSAPQESQDSGRGRQVARIMECIRGSVRFTVECCPRFDYGTIVPHAALDGPNSGFAHGGVDALSLYCSAPLQEIEGGFQAEGLLKAGEKLYAVVTYQPRFPVGHRPFTSHDAAVLDHRDIERSQRETRRFWEEWSSLCTYDGEYRDEVLRSALTLKALTYAPSGALLAAATTSLPEAIGGSRNWDYRFTWIRDASFALYALFIIGYTAEARAFKDWLEWSTVGRARDLQIMYGLGGERRLTETELPELDGYRSSRPVRVGNAAYSQFQLDIYGEILDSAHLYRKFGGEMDPAYWEYLQRVVAFVIDHWREPDEGIWEARSGRRHFVSSKVWCWVALDRAIKAARALDLPGDVERWRKVRAEIKEDVLANGYDAERKAFVQAYGSKKLDASNLLLPLVGFISADEPRMRSTIEAIERELTSPQGFVYRYKGFDDGLSGGEGTFPICTFWLADNLIALGELERARNLFEKLRACANDLGLFSEESDGETGEMLGNFPQSFSHLAFISTAVQLHEAEVHRRGTRASRSSESTS
ncbi:MAG: glycoside hydrolase family 15 protein [Chloroflexi bacterium]|nr:glycoside hydrolase family 15 protein [Chloroflexota bacterium]